jgi:threonine dehydrogenase-like Zn-dependent dehydrogenase
LIDVFVKAGALKRKCPFVTCDRGEGHSILGTVGAMIGRAIWSPITYKAFLNKPCTKNLQATAELVAAGKWPSALGKVFPFEEAPQAMELVRSKKGTGKVVIQLI